MFGASMTTATRELTNWVIYAGQYPKLAMTRFRRMDEPIRQRVLPKVRIKPGPVVYANNGKLRWSSRRQQKAFRASEGFGGGVPHVRTGAYTDAYDVEYFGGATEGGYQVVNPYPGAEYIGGDDQEPFIVDTGWLKLSSVLDEERPPVQDLVIEQMHSLDGLAQGRN